MGARRRKASTLPHSKGFRPNPGNIPVRPFWVLEGEEGTKREKNTRARWQGALAPQLPRATRISEFPFEHLFSFMDFGWSTGCFILCFQPITLVTIAHLFTPKNLFFKSTSDRSINKSVDPPCGVQTGYFRGILHCFGRGKTRG